MQKASLLSSSSSFLSFCLCQREGSADERQAGLGRVVDPFWLPLHTRGGKVVVVVVVRCGSEYEWARPRLIIIKTRTTWHVYLMAAPGEDGKLLLLLSLSVTCWSTAAPCVTGRVCARARAQYSVPAHAPSTVLQAPERTRWSRRRRADVGSGRSVLGLSGSSWLFLPMCLCLQWNFVSAEDLLGLLPSNLQSKQAAPPCCCCCSLQSLWSLTALAKYLQITIKQFFWAARITGISSLKRFVHWII